MTYSYHMIVWKFQMLWNRVRMLTQKKHPPIVKIYPRILLSIFLFVIKKTGTFQFYLMFIEL